MAETVDSALKQRLRVVLARKPVTEAELRKLGEEGRACTLVLSAQLARGEQTLAQLAADPPVRSRRSQPPYGMS